MTNSNVRWKPVITLKDGDDLQEKPNKLGVHADMTEALDIARQDMEDAVESGLDVVECKAVRHVA